MRAACYSVEVAEEALTWLVAQNTAGRWPSGAGVVRALPYGEERVRVSLQRLARDGRAIPTRVSRRTGGYAWRWWASHVDQPRHVHLGEIERIYQVAIRTPWRWPRRHRRDCRVEAAALMLLHEQRQHPRLYQIRQRCGLTSRQVERAAASLVEQGRARYHRDGVATRLEVLA